LQAFGDEKRRPKLASFSPVGIARAIALALKIGFVFANLKLASDPGWASRIGFVFARSHG